MAEDTMSHGHPDPGRGGGKASAPRRRSLARCALSIACAVSLAGCSTQTQLLTLQRDRLLRIEQNADAVNANAGQMLYRPADYDLYMTLNRSTFDTLLEGFNGTTVQVDAGSRAIEISLTSIRMAFRPGSPEVSIDATARDIATGIEADVKMDSRLILEGDLAQPDQLTLRIVATRLVPNIRWGVFDLSRYRFAQRLLALEATSVTDKLPAVTLPLAHDFSIGAPQTTRSITMPVGRGTITGNLTTPATLTQGRIAVQHVVFLRNGVHIFANVEGV